MAFFLCNLVDWRIIQINQNYSKYKLISIFKLLFIVTVCLHTPFLVLGDQMISIVCFRILTVFTNMVNMCITVLIIFEIKSSLLIKLKEIDHILNLLIVKLIFYGLGGAFYFVNNLLLVLYNDHHMIPVIVTMTSCGIVDVCDVLIIMLFIISKFKVKVKNTNSFNKKINKGTTNNVINSSENV